MLTEGASWSSYVTAALSAALTALAERFGDDSTGWRWGDMHQVTPLHPLRKALGDAVRPTSGPISGASGCVMATNELGGITSNALTGSVARYLWNVANPAASGWIVPLGASGDPHNAHFTDQTEQYVAVELIPVVSPPVSTLTLSPG